MGGGLGMNFGSSYGSVADNLAGRMAMKFFGVGFFKGVISKEFKW